MKPSSQLILLFTLILIRFPANGASPDESFRQGNQAYTEGAYQQAIDHYETILDSGVASASLYYNLGNAYFQLEMKGMARLNYERARRLNPGNDAILHNINLLKESIPGEDHILPKPRVLEWRDYFTGLQRPDAWAWTAIILVLVLAVSLAAVYMTPFPARKKLFLAIAAVFLLGILASIYAAGRQYHLEYVKQHAVVMEDNVAARSAPGDNGQELFILPEGIKVEVNTTMNSWLEIRLPDGHTGWLPDKSVEVI